MTTEAGNRTKYDQVRYMRRKQELTALLGGECARCGTAESLEFDHIDPPTKSFSIMARWSADLSELVPELLKCQLLCVDCHSAKTASGLSVPHGGGKSGRKNCKCDPCRERKNEYMREWKRARRKQGVRLP